MIESYKFGTIIVNGKRYDSDLIILPDRIIDGWWRKEGHRLHVEDLREILELKPKPEVLVLGTGYHGLVKVPQEVIDTLESEGIEPVVEHTKKAAQTFNKLLKSRNQVAAAFHLTC